MLYGRHGAVAASGTRAHDENPNELNNASLSARHSRLESSRTFRASRVVRCRLITRVVDAQHNVAAWPMWPNDPGFENRGTPFGAFLSSHLFPAVWRMPGAAYNLALAQLQHSLDSQQKSLHRPPSDSWLVDQLTSSSRVSPSPLRRGHLPSWRPCTLYFMT